MSAGSDDVPAGPQGPAPRRALSHQGGEVRTAGDEDTAAELRGALRDADGIADNPAAPRYTHGFHSYPARMEPAVVRAVLARFATPERAPALAEGAPLLDPYCGSGTVLVEARARGLASHGVDLSPLAIRVAAIHTSYRAQGDRARFLQTLDQLALVSEERVRSRTRARAPLGPDERRWYQPHVLLELAGLYEEIQKVEPAADRRAAEILLSSMVVKFSRQRADTAQVEVNKRLRKGLVTEFFLRKGRELVDRWAELCDAIGSKPVRQRLSEGDSRDLPRLLPDGFAAGLVLTSPPYGGTYDYVEHHARRYPWLGMAPRHLAQAEIGARRDLSTGHGAAERWERQLGQALGAIAQVTARDAPILLWVGDGQVGGRRVAADEQLRRLAPSCGLQVLASASQRRPDFTGGPARNEHLVALRHGS